MEEKPLRTGGELEKVMDRYQNMVYGLALARTGSAADADDVFQEVFLAYFRTGKTFREEEHRKAWLLRVTNATYRKKVVPLEAGENIPAAPFRAPEENRVWQAMQALPENYRLPIYLFYFEELSTDEIAKALSIRPGTARMRLSRGRDLLRELLKGEYFDE